MKNDIENNPGQREERSKKRKSMVDFFKQYAERKKGQCHFLSAVHAAFANEHEIPYKRCIGYFEIYPAFYKCFGMSKGEIKEITWHSWLEEGGVITDLTICNQENHSVFPAFVDGKSVRTNMYPLGYFKIINGEVVNGKGKKIAKYHYSCPSKITDDDSFRERIPLDILGNRSVAESLTYSMGGDIENDLNRALESNGYGELTLPLGWTRKLQEFDAERLYINWKDETLSGNTMEDYLEGLVSKLENARIKRLVLVSETFTVIREYKHPSNEELTILEIPYDKAMQLSKLIPKGDESIRYDMNGWLMECDAVVFFEEANAHLRTLAEEYPYTRAIIQIKP